MDAYAPVAQIITLRILIVTHLHLKDVKFRKLDVKNAYINEDMRRLVWVRMPPGYTIYFNRNGKLRFRRLAKGEKVDADLCMRLLKALYGGMECGRIFWEAWVKWHLDNGFQIIHEERCYLHKRDAAGNFIKLVYHVDDNAIVYRGDAFYASYLKELGVKFDVEEGALDSHLGVKYTFDHENGTVQITQAAQITKVLKEFGMEDCNPSDAPVPSGTMPCDADIEDPYLEPWDMEKYEGHVLYLNMCTRPDISQSVKITSRYTKKFGKKHVKFAKHLLRYLKGTRNMGLTYRSGFPLYLQIFTDSSHANCVDTRRSLNSIVVKLGGNTIYWKCSKSKIVSHSSTESELMALDIGATLSEFTRWLIEAIGGPEQETVQVFVDNNGARLISTNPVQPGRNLHVHARFYYCRDLHYAGLIAVCNIPTDEQVADVGCTFKGGPSFLRLREYLMECARVVHDQHGNPGWEILSES
jgi:hypothetical protein